MKIAIPGRSGLLFPQFNKRNHFLSMLLVSLIWLAGVSTVAGTELEVRPKIGLALSGGGSRGAAHIGVLRELERQRIPIDYIAGTSVGSIIGGLYAAGMSVDEIEEVVVHSNLDDIFKDEQSRHDTAPRRKFDHRVFQLDKEIGVKKGKIHLPSGLRQGQKLELFLSKLLLSVSHVNNFDNLPIAFRAVATDIATGEPVVIGHGSIVKAIRASMSIPAVFSDVTLDDRILVDGGISNNLPIDVVRNMGADIVIAVDIGSRLLKKEKLDNALKISLQLTSLLVRRTTQEQIRTLSSQDILITPDLSGFSSTDFKEADSIVPSGAEATRALAGKLRPLALSSGSYQAYLGSRHSLDEGVPVIDTVEIKNNSRLSSTYLRSKIHQPEGEALDFSKLEKDISIIHGLGIFQSVSYDVVESQGETQLVIDVEEKPWGPNYLQFGLSYSSDLTENNDLSLVLGYTVLPTNARNGEWRSILRLGEELGVFTEYHQPFGLSSRYYVNGSLAMTNRLFNVYEDGQEINSIRDGRVGGALAVGREFGTWGDLRMGYGVFSSQTKIKTGEPNSKVEDFDGGELFVRFLSDTWDSAFFPSEGLVSRLDWVGSRTDLGADRDFDKLLLDGAWVNSFHRTSVLLGAKFASTVNGVVPIQSGFRLGGLFNLPGFANNELSGQNAFLVRSGVQQNLGRIVGLSTYAGASLQYGNVFQTRDSTRLDDGIFATSAWLGWKTIIGPIFLGYGYAETGDSSIYLEIGSHF